ncbi:LADA_0F02938g1_1 [Lachancea dasiensis]|uniref:LADA_0F02938g1_1 n=1 Tax=Lachancea dasiensis TaxID=1072105 RepID=A0A1G4JIJ5_9SACH|nr:LADA_0F02938g1_1 [Lachancea dasiensis]
MVHDGDKGYSLEAVQLWELGVSKEKDGLMMDAVECYRRALKMDESVEKEYRKIVASSITSKEVGSVKPALKGSTANHKYGIKEDGHLHDGAGENDVEAEPLPCWLLEKLPDDILQQIVHQIVATSGESWLNLSLTCKKFQELCFKKPDSYRTFAQHIYPRQQYDDASMTLNGLSSILALEQALWGTDYRRMLSERAYIKFQGCYISVVNYLRHGANPTGSSSLISPVHMITYYRYLRFFSNGTCLRLVTTDEPSSVARHFHPNHHLKGAELCHWSCSIDDDFSILTVKRHNEKYHFVETLRIQSHGRRRFHRLQWVKSEAYQDSGDRIDFSMHSEKPFLFSRVNYQRTDPPNVSKEGGIHPQNNSQPNNSL